MRNPAPVPLIVFFGPGQGVEVLLGYGGFALTHA